MDNQGNQIEKQFNFSSDPKRKATQILILIISLGLILRLWGIWFGLPYLYHVDERHEVLRAMQLGMGSFNFDRVSKGGYFYLLFVEFGIYFVLLKISGLIQSTTEFAYMFISEPWSFYLIGRITTALIGTLNVFFVYLIGKEIYSVKTGLLAALFLAFNFIHAANSHYIQVDVPMTCFATIALFYYIRIMKTGNNVSYIGAAFFTVLAVITKIPAVLLLFSFVLAHYFNIRRRRKNIKEFFFGKKTITAVSIILIVAGLGNPGLFLKLPEVVLDIATKFLSTSPSSLTEVQYQTDPPNMFLYYLTALKTAMGLPLLLISAVAIVYGLYKRKKEDILLIAFVLIYYFVFSLSKSPHLYYPRYILPILPALALISSSLFFRIKWRFSPNMRTGLVVLAACVLILEPGYKIILKNYKISHVDTRTLAKEWIEKNIPLGSKILIEGSRTKVDVTNVPLQNSRNNIIKSINNYKYEEPIKAKYLKLQLDVMSGVTYDLILVGTPIGGSDFRLKHLSYYKKIGVEYLVLRPDVYFHHRKLKKYFLPFVQAVRSDNEIRLLKRFEPDRLIRPGPVIEIYKIQTKNNM